MSDPPDPPVTASRKASLYGNRETVEYRKKVGKGEWWMPRLMEAMKDVISCVKPRVGANSL